MKAVGRAFGLRKSSKDRSNTDSNNMTHEQQQQQYYQQQQLQQQQQQQQQQQGFSNGEGHQQYQQLQIQPLPPLPPPGGHPEQHQGYNSSGDAGTLEPRQRSFSSSSSQRQQQQQIPSSLPASIHFKSFPNAGSLGVKLMYHNLMFIDGKGIAQSINCLVINGFANGGSSPSPESIREGATQSITCFEHRF